MASHTAANQHIAIAVLSANADDNAANEKRQESDENRDESRNLFLVLQCILPGDKSDDHCVAIGVLALPR